MGKKKTVNAPEPVSKEKASPPKPAAAPACVMSSAQLGELGSWAGEQKHKHEAAGAKVKSAAFRVFQNALSVVHGIVENEEHAARD